MKRHFVQVAVVTMALAISPQVYAQSIETDYDRAFDLGSLKTFNFFTQTRAPGDPLAEVPFVEQRIQEGLTNALAARGIQKADYPDFLIAIYAKVGEESQWNVTGYGGWGAGWRYGGGYGSGTISEYKYAVGTVVVDFVSRAKNAAVWHASATRTVDLEKSEKNIRKGTEKLVGEFVKDVQKQQKSKAKS